MSKDQDGRTPYTLNELIQVANELNNELHLKPPINLHLEKDDLEDYLLEACKMVNFRIDRFTAESESIITHLRRYHNKYVRFQQAKMIRVAKYIEYLLKQKKWTRNQVRLLTEKHFKGTVAKKTIEFILSFARRPKHKHNKFGDRIMVKDPDTKIEELKLIKDVPEDQIWHGRNY